MSGQVDKYQKALDLGNDIAKLSQNIKDVDYLLGRVSLEASITGNGTPKPAYVLKDSMLLTDLLKRHRGDLVVEFTESQTALSKL